MPPKEKYKEILGLFGQKYCELDTLQKQYDNGVKLPQNAFKTMTPTRIFFEPTNNCNLDCSYCARSKMDREISYLSMDAFKTGVSSLPKGAYLVMVGNGEPLLNNKIYDMIRFAVDEGLLVGIITNGTILTKRNAVKLIESGVHRVQISFDTINREIFEKVQGPLNNFDKTLHKIVRFIHLARKEYSSNLFITISAVMTEDVKKAREKTRNFWNCLPVDNLYEGPLLSMQTDSGLYKEAMRFEQENWKICVNPWTSLKINADGTVNPCVLDVSSKYIVGNINDEPIMDIVNSEKFLALRRALYYRDIDFFKEIGYNCHMCNVWTDKAGYNIRKYLANGFPITYGLMVNEISNRSCYETDKIERLEKILDNYDAFIKEINE